MDWGFLMEANSNRGIGCNKDQSIHSLQNKIHTPLDVVSIYTS